MHYENKKSTVTTNWYLVRSQLLALHSGRQLPFFRNRSRRCFFFLVIFPYSSNSNTSYFVCRSTGARARNGCARPSVSAQPPARVTPAPAHSFEGMRGYAATASDLPRTLLRPSVPAQTSSSPPRYPGSPHLLPLRVASLCATPLHVHPPCARPRCSRAPLARGAPLFRCEGGAREPGLEGKRGPTASPALSRKERAGRGAVGAQGGAQGSRSGAGGKGGGQ